MIGTPQQLKFSLAMDAIQAFVRAIVIGAVIIVGACLVRNVTTVLTDAVHGPAVVGTMFAATPSR